MTTPAFVVALGSLIFLAPFGVSRCGSHRLEVVAVVVVRVLSGLYVDVMLSPTGELQQNKFTRSGNLSPTYLPPRSPEFLVSTPVLVGLHVILGLSVVDLYVGGCSDKLAPIWVVCLLFVGVLYRRQ
jgi:hypothetical protein